MAAIAVDIADAVRSELAAATLSVEFTPVRSYADWLVKLEDLDELRVDVVPVPTGESDLLDRGTLRYLVTVEIGVRKRFEGAEITAATGRIVQAEIDALVLLVEEINEFFSGDRMTDFAAATWYETRLLARYHRKQLREWNQFTGVVQVAFHATKAL